MDRPPQPQLELLSPWRECHTMHVGVKNTQAVVLENKVYIGGGSMEPSPPTRLLIYDIAEDSWDIIDTPTQWYALTTYHSKLVLIGGKRPVTQAAANELWVLNKQHNWTQPLPPMTTKRYQTSAVSVSDHLIVAGGCGGGCPLDEVEIYDGHQWKKVESLPRASVWMNSTLHEGNWYLAGGIGQKNEVYYTSLESLIATSVEAGQTSVWKKLPDAPLERSATAMLGDQLITVGGGKPLSSAIHAYSPSTNSWLYAGDLPVTCRSASSIVLPTEELLVVGGETKSGLLHCSYRARSKVSSPPNGLSDNQQEAALEVTDYLKGVEVIAETNVVITNQACTFNWAGYGLKLHIPQGALPAGLEKCKLLMKVGLSGQFELPENTSLVSAVYWIDSEPRRKFTQLLTVEIQHCVNRALTAKLSFVHAKCSQKYLPYEFEKTKEGEFPRESAYGFVQLTHFSIWSVIYKMLVPGVLYRARLYYLRREVNQIDIHFVITKDLDTHAKVVQQEYAAKDAIIGPDFPIEFEEDCMLLQLPSEEESLESGWRIVPLFHPQITKKQVDNFTPSGIPSCQLAAEWIEQGMPSRISHKVTLMGAKGPSNFFRIVLPGRVRTRSLLSEATLSPDEHIASVPDLSDLMDALYHKVADKWKFIGIYLHFPMAILSTIAADNQNEPHKCLMAMLDAWRNRVEPPATWSSIIKTVEFLGDEQLAKELREKYTPV